MKYQGPIIDFRIRPSTPEIASAAQTRAFSKILNTAGYSGDVQPVSALVRQMDEAGIAAGVVQGRDIETTYDYRIPNEHIADIVAEFPDRFIGFGGVDPNKGMDAVREVVRCVRELGLAGISIDPFLHQRPASEAQYYPVYAKCQELDVIMNITTGPGGGVPDSVLSDASPMMIDEVARDFPNLKIVVSHGGYPFVTEMIAIALRHKNVYFECSSYEDMPGSEAYPDAANRFIPGKLLYASAHPYFDFRKRLDIYAAWPLTDEVRAKVMYQNAADLLGLEVTRVATL